MKVLNSCHNICQERQILLSFFDILREIQSLTENKLLPMCNDLEGERGG